MEENSKAGTIVGAVDASDPDEGQVVSYEIIDGNNDKSFVINESTGILSVNNPTILDYETLQQLTLTISVSDSHEKDPLESSAKVLINLTDENESTPVVEDQSFEMDENSAQGFEIGSIVATDEESHQKLQYTIVESSNSSYFSLDQATGKLTVLDSAAFDFESNKELYITVQVSDGHENPKTALASVTVSIKDVLEITDGLVLYLPFDGNVKDSWGDYNGTAHNVNYTQDDQNSNNEFLSLSGQDSYVTLDNPFDLETISVSFSFKVKSAENNLGILYTSDNPGLMYGLTTVAVRKTDESKVELYCNFSTIIDTVEIVEDKWYDLTMIRNNKSYFHYLDGELIGSGYLVDYVSSNNGNSISVLGSARTTTTYYYNGLLEDLRVYNRAISKEDINNLFK